MSVTRRRWRPQEVALKYAPSHALTYPPGAAFKAARAVSLMAAACCALFSGPALAHDTWLEQRPGGAAGQVELALTTGTLFPAAESGTPAASLVDRGCVAISGKRVRLAIGSSTPSALGLRATPQRGDALRHCWVQTEAFEVEVPAALVAVYLREIGAAEPMHEAWAEQQRLAQPWLERYTKHARISFRAPAGSAVAASAAAAPGTTPAPTPPAAPPMAFDIEIDAVATLMPGQAVSFRVLRDGLPLAGQAVELRGDLSRLGLWRRTDAEGRASVPLPFAGRWVLRATDLRSVPGRPGHWESRFVTHTFTVPDGPSTGAAQPSNPPSMPNARSTNHHRATAAMSNEPPVSTTRR